MPDTYQPHTDTPADQAQRMRVFARLQQIEGNPLTAADLAMFEMFEREGWSSDRRRAYIIAEAVAEAAE